MKIVQDGDGWMLVNNDGIEVARRSTEAAMQEHLDRLSAVKAVAERDPDSGELIEHRPTMSRKDISANNHSRGPRCAAFPRLPGG